MPKLSNPRWEAFAQGLYRNETADEAYQKAGYKPNRHNASRLKTTETIKKRLAELQEQGQRMSDITVESLTRMYLDTLKEAREDKQHSAASTTIERIAKLHGLHVERTENQNMNYVVYGEEEDDTVEEWAEQAVH